ncbi:TonB-dependent siderophore receptor [Methyloprofundus sp.]|uniref:TonB-dependent siderophore receptor n=1 Tax=Methyloprofundus sp. TaxID=2020875 RepID=UPI003D13A5B8
MTIIALAKHVRITERTSVLLIYTVMQCQSAPVRADQTTAFNIPAQPLASALLQFSEQSGIKIFFKAESTRSITSKSLIGQYTPQQALSKLLENTGIQYRFTESQSVALSPASSENRPPEVISLEPAMVVYTDFADQNRPLGQIDLSRNNEARRSYSSFYSSTATRINTPLMQLPQSVQVITRALIDDQQAITISESLRNISGVVPRSLSITPNFEPTLIRGFSTMQMIDGFYQNLNTGDQESLVNVAQIEVIKGPNATLYSGGDGSPSGGVINLLSKLPEQEAFYTFGIKTGNYQFVQPYMDINQPLNENYLFRFTGEYTHNKNHIEVLDTQRYNINPSITWTNNDNTSFTLQGKYSNWQQQDYQGLPSTGTVAGDFTIKPELFIGPADIGESVSKLGSVWATFKHRFNPIWDMTAKARYAYSMHDTLSQGLVGEGFDFAADIPLNSEDLALLGYPDLPHTWGLSNTELFQQSDEMTFQLYSTAQFDFSASYNSVIIGADFSKHDEAGFIEFDQLPTQIVDLTNPSFFPDTYPGVRNNNQFTKNTTFGSYIQAQSTLYERLHLLAGFRVSTIISDFNNTTPGFEFSSNTSTTRVLPNIGVVITLTDEFGFFVNYSQGMRAQSGVNFVSTPKPELSDQVELGIKFDIARQLTGQLALYRINKQNIVVTDFTDPLFRSTTKGKQSSQGIETNLNWHATESLSFLATYAYTDAWFADDLIVSEGNHIPGVPEHAGRFWVNYAFQQKLLQGLSIGTGIYAQSSTYIENENLFKSDAFYTMDASLAYTRERYKLGISVKNLTDVDYYQRLNYFGSRVIPAQGTEVFSPGQ